MACSYMNLFRNGCHESECNRYRPDISGRGTEDAQITVELEDESEYDITIDGADAGKMKTNLGGKLSLSVELGDHPVDVKVTKC